jgi:hypothetical protein
MSDLDFELNIEKYTPEELEQMMKLKFPYSSDDIDESIGKLRKEILSDKNLEEIKQREIISFLESVHNKLNKKIIDSRHKALPNIISQHGNNFIIERNTQKIRNPDGIPPSVRINPYRSDPGDSISFLNNWKEGVTTYLLSIDTRFRNNYYATSSTDFIVDLPVNINNVVSLELVSLEIPATYFSISKKLGNNYFHIVNTSAPGETYKITLPDGSYSREQMQSELNLIFATVFTGNIPEASIDTKSGRTIIDLKTVNRSIYFNLPQDLDKPGSAITTPIDTTPIQMKLGWILGYRAAEYTGSPVSTTYVSEGVYDGWGSRYFYFVLDDFNKNSVNGIDAVLNASVLSENILARLTRGAISSAVNAGFTLDTGIVNSDSATRKRVFFGPVNIKKLKIRILDAYGRLIDLNNMDYSFALRLDRLYD